jgi:hypothetical protein
VQSALTGRTALAREYTESDLSAEFRANGTTEPTDPDYQKLAQNGLKIGASLWTASFRSLQVSRWPNSTRRSTTPGVAPVCIMDELQFQTADPPRLARQTPDDRDSRGHPGPKGALGHRRAAGGRGADQYFDRINLSVGAPQLQQEFGLTDGELGWLFSGFFWSYALLQIPTGMILDRFGVTSVYRVSAFLLVVRLRRDRVRQRVYRYPRGTLSAGGDRGAGIPGERQGYRLLVSAR